MSLILFRRLIALNPFRNEVSFSFRSISTSCKIIPMLDCRDATPASPAGVDVASNLIQQLLKSAIRVDSVYVASFKKPKFLNGIHGSRALNQMRTNNSRMEYVYLCTELNAKQSEYVFQMSNSLRQPKHREKGIVTLAGPQQLSCLAHFLGCLHPNLHRAHRHDPCEIERS